jgi:hypothetical protein
MSHSFRIGDEAADHIAVEVLAREHPDKSDYWDGNWLTANVDVACGPWQGNYRAALRAEEFAHFRDQLQRLEDDGEAPPAEFESMEPWLRFNVHRSDRHGHLRISGHAQTEPFFDSHNILYFVLELDRSFMSGTLDELAQVIEEFPVIGARLFDRNDVVGWARFESRP